MKYEITRNEFEYTGGGCWLLFSKIQFGKRIIYASTNEDSCFLYNNEEDCYNCENSFYNVWYEEKDNPTSVYSAIIKKLFNEFDRLYEEHKYD